MGVSTPSMRRPWMSLSCAGAGAGMIAVCAACSDTPLPGQLLGTYKVTGQVQTNTCGLDAPNPWIFDVQMSRDSTLLYWSWLDGTAALSAPVDSQGNVVFTATQQANADGTADGGLGPCSMERDDRLTLTLGSGSPPTGFTGTIAYAIAPTAGSDCSDQLTTSGGLYDTLPCTMTYAVTANAVSNP